MGGVAELFEEFGREMAGDVGAAETGYAKLDRLIGGGYRPGHVCVLAGSPGTGKSIFVLNQIRNFTEAKIPARMLPLEDDSAALARRGLAMLAGDYGIDRKSVV